VLSWFVVLLLLYPAYCLYLLCSVFNQPPLTSDILAQHEDGRSESSEETETYDSGRGGSESDIQTSMSQSHDNGEEHGYSFSRINTTKGLLLLLCLLKGEHIVAALSIRPHARPHVRLTTSCSGNNS